MRQNLEEDIKRFLQIVQYDTKQGNKKTKLISESYKSKLLPHNSNKQNVKNNLMLEAGPLPIPAGVSLESLTKSIDKVVKTFEKSAVGTTERAIYDKWINQLDNWSTRLKFAEKPKTFSELVAKLPQGLTAARNDVRSFIEGESLGQSLIGSGYIGRQLGETIIENSFRTNLKLYRYYMLNPVADEIPMVTMKRLIEKDFGVAAANKFQTMFEKTFKNAPGGYESMTPEVMDAILQKAYRDKNLFKKFLSVWPRLFVKSWYNRLFKSYENLIKEIEQLSKEIEDMGQMAVDDESILMKVESLISKVYTLQGTGWLKSLLPKSWGMDTNPWRGADSMTLLNNLVLENPKFTPETRQMLKEIVQKQEEFQSLHKVTTDSLVNLLIPFAERLGTNLQTFPLLNGLGVWFIRAGAKKRGITSGVPELINPTNLKELGTLLYQLIMPDFKRLGLKILWSSPRTGAEMFKSFNSRTTHSVLASKFFDVAITEFIVVPYLTGLVEWFYDNMTRKRADLDLYLQNQKGILQACGVREQFLAKAKEKAKVEKTSSTTSNNDSTKVQTKEGESLTTDEICNRVREEHRKLLKKIDEWKTDEAKGIMDYYKENLPLAITEQLRKEGAYGIDDERLSIEVQNRLKNIFFITKIDEIIGGIFNAAYYIVDYDIGSQIKDFEALKANIKQLPNELEKELEKSPCYDKSLELMKLYEQLENCEPNTNERTFLNWCIDHDSIVKDCSKNSVDNKFYATNKTTNVKDEYVWNEDKNTYITKKESEYLNSLKSGENNNETSFKKWCELMGYENPLWDPINKAHEATYKSDNKRYYIFYDNKEDIKNFYRAGNVE